MRTLNSITVERVRELFSYDSETGALTRKVRLANKSKIGDVVGYSSADGYLRTEIGGVSYLVHRLVWFHYYGAWPVQVLDHKDRDPSNNRISNLQDVSQALNSQNQGSRKRSTSKFKGVSWVNRDRRWVAVLRFSGRVIRLGHFTDEKEASEAYLVAAKIYHPNSNPANL